MNFQVPQYIEHEPKIVGPLTLKQFLYLAGAGAACFILYFSAPFIVFITAAFILGSLALALAFLKVGGRPLLTYFSNFFSFLFKPKIYLWQKKEAMINFKVVKEEKKEEKEEETVSLKIAEKSRLKDLSMKVETRIKQ